MRCDSSVYVVGPVRNSHRGRGVTRNLAEVAVQYARKHKAHHVEVYSIEPTKTLTWGEVFVGLASVFGPSVSSKWSARSPKRPLMRIELGRPLCREMWETRPKLVGASVGQLSLPAG